MGRTLRRSLATPTLAVGGKHIQWIVSAHIFSAKGLDLECSIPSKWLLMILKWGESVFVTLEGQRKRTKKTFY
jgi:hypothetical protein